MSNTIQTLVPPTEWADFRDSSKVIDLLWERCHGWRYMNHGGASIWENPGPSGGTVFVTFQGDDIAGLDFYLDEGSNFDGLLSELQDRFGLTPLAGSGGAE